MERTAAEPAAKTRSEPRKPILRTATLTHHDPRTVLLGTLMGIGAYASWGGVVIYFKAVQHVPAVTLVSHRVLASLPFIFALTAVFGGLPRLKRLLADRRTLGVLPLSAALLGANWLLFVICIVTGRVMQASLAYFLTPLVMVLLGVTVLGERLSRLQGIGVSLAAVGVIVLGIFSNEIPWLSFAIACTWSAYSLIRKLRDIPAIEGLGAEVVLLCLPAAAYLTWYGWLPPRETSPYSVPVEVILLAAGGIVTAGPLMLFGGAARRVPLTTIGFLQYIAPTMQFLLAVLLYSEPFDARRGVAFGLIWAALVFYSIDSIYKARQRRRIETPAVPPSPTPDAI